MKKIILPLALLVSGAANADTILGGKVGVDVWRVDTQGSVAANSTSSTSGNFDAKTQGRIWVALEHPLPFIPNVMLRASQVDTSGSYTVGAQTGRQGYNLSHADLVLYYELLDNDILSLDAGAAYRLMNGELDYKTGNLSGTKDIDSGIFMGHANAELSLPGFDLYGFVDVNVGINERDVYDYSAGLGYKFDLAAFDVNLRAGYRDFTFDVNKFSGINANTKADGYFVGVELDF
ncbi:TIGR04219 family outer membrane beta-barrel protein [Shewanella sp. 202IG2-18]|uniref:TIGR04219 family outer membrane beta-barrel protein n=1 Tax=Parashewanella hymeniacidonis TaxID=2807618 RepID=UPI0019617C10|nr:TIGR04219 family outer membrane beta-barrel protein [Parashewanella hymeniacidonis]MBM7070688.1 TIGR04219 family outer membrane beta-barrel protein [Parashewanella hymeniacidonis]